MRFASLCALTVMGLLVPAGAFAHDWQDLPDRAAIMFLTAHPDDEGIFFGGTLPYYSQVRNLPTVLVGMTSGDFWDYQGFEGGWPREQELRNAAAIYGVPYEPIFTRFKDVWTDNLSATGLPSFNDPYDPDQTFQWWDDQDDRSGPHYSRGGNDIYGTPADSPEQGRRTAALALAQLIRDRKPTVIATHDPVNGEYGHGNHKATAIAMQAAWDLAAGRSASIGSTSIAPDTLSGDPWEAAKVYLHLLDENQGAMNALFHTGLEDSRSELGGDSCRDVANDGANQHVSQGGTDVETIFANGEGSFGENESNSEEWGLWRSTVGSDTESTIPSAVSDRLDADDIQFLNNQNGGTWHYGDFLEHVDLTAFADYLADVDGDGAVDMEDWDLMNGYLGQSVPMGSVAMGDATGDGYVDEADLAIARAAGVPEPATLMLLGLGGAALLKRRRR
ncbi:MAG: PIG-L family deacetylase [Phycisphaerae bacterium]|nr:PIG-L family deacetylase [Phycisphaerae bacterium]